MKSINKTSTLCLVFTTLVLTITGCIWDDSLKNKDFNEWCGENLCLWETNEGKIEKVTTWHRQDFGAAFAEDPTIISQRVENGNNKCFLFTVTADVDDNAELFFEIDYNDDDLLNPEFSQIIEAPDWNQVKVDIAVPDWCEKFRVIFRKTGKGRAVAASVIDSRYENCPITVTDNERPSGMICVEDDQCRGGICEPFNNLSEDILFYSCGECTVDGDCGNGSVCGLEFLPDKDLMYQACGKQGRHLLGERCFLDDECKSGICCAGQCSTCCNNDDCPSNVLCEELTEITPHRCGPNAGGAAAGESCLADADCKSDKCESVSDTKTLRVCTSDGRRCTADADCPGYMSSDSIWGIANEFLGTVDKCQTLGVLDGKCL